MFEAVGLREGCVLGGVFPFYVALEGVGGGVPPPAGRTFVGFVGVVVSSAGLGVSDVLEDDDLLLGQLLEGEQVLVEVII